MNTKVIDLLNELQEGNKEEYKKFFNKTLAKYNVKSPAELSSDKKKEFFKAIELGWTKEKDHDKDDKDVAEENKIRALIRSIMQEIINEK